MGPGQPIYEVGEEDALSISQAIESAVNVTSERFDHAATDNEGAQKGRSQGIGPIEPSAIESIRKSRVAQEIIVRLWNKDWEPEASILSTCPEKSSSSPQELKSAISKSLRFNSINNREEAITATFQSTYQWVFSRTPSPSITGEPMWSSLPDWLESNSQLPYWITGKPGAGKSTAMKYIANHPAINKYLSRWAGGFPIYKIKYYAWKPGLDLAKSEKGLLRTLLYQTIEKNPDLAPLLCPRRWALFHTVRELDPRDLPAWTDWELHESFSRLLSLARSKMRLMIFVDGLDEFDVAPMQLCSLIQGIARHDAIKVCVASRSWAQFNDAFADSPGMQMHLLTHDDINAYVFGHFAGVRAFSELNSLYQDGGDRLLDQIVSKAHGVFLWTAIVTQTIYQSLAEGASLPQLQSTLDKMPPEIETLYDAIYTAIPERLLPEVSVMLQIHVSACTPVDWMTLWLADETRGVRTNMDIHALDMDQVHAALKRRLSARTRGILDAVMSTQTVEFLHRTAAEWVKQPRVWEQLRSVSPTGFDPHMCLLRAEIIKMENLKDVGSLEAEDVWRSVTSSLLYTSLVDDSATPEKLLVEAVDQLHQATSNSFSPGSTLALTDIMWPTYQPSRDWVQLGQTVPRNGFHGLAVQFAILPYVRRKYEEYPAGFHSVPAKRSRALLEQAIFGAERYSAPSIIAGVDLSKISHAQRLDTIAYLLSKGFRQAGIVSSINEVEGYCSGSSREDDIQYYNDVRHLLQSNHALGDGKRAYIKGRFGTKMRKWFR